MYLKRIIGAALAALLGAGVAVSVATPAQATIPNWVHVGPYALQDLMNPPTCITATSTTPGQRPINASCNYNVWQNWMFDRVPGTSNVYEIRISSGDDSCLDVGDVNPNRFAAVIQWTCHQGYNQLFTVTLASTGAVQLRSWAGWCITASDTYLWMDVCSPETLRNMFWLM